MKKNYLVKITLVSEVVVMGAEDEEKAMEYANDELGLFGKADADEFEVEEIPDGKLESYRKHANAIAEDL